jgi:hypothetical protein
MFQSIPGELKQHSLLGVKKSRLSRRKPEKVGVEALYSIHDTTGCHEIRPVPQRLRYRRIDLLNRKSAYAFTGFDQIAPKLL